MRSVSAGFFSFNDGAEDPCDGDGGRALDVVVVAEELVAVPVWDWGLVSKWEWCSRCGWSGGVECSARVWY